MDSTIPAPSCPRTMGNAPSGSLPESVYASVIRSVTSSKSFLVSFQSYQYGRHQYRKSQCGPRGPSEEQPQYLPRSGPCLPPTQQQPSNMSILCQFTRCIPKRFLTLHVMVCQSSDVSICSYDVYTTVSLQRRNHTLPSCGEVPEEAVGTMESIFLKARCVIEYC